MAETSMPQASTSARSGAPAHLRTNLPQEAAQVGLVAGCVTLGASMIGLVETFDGRDVITNTLSMGELLLFAAPVVAGFMTIRRAHPRNMGGLLGYGALSGAASALPVLALIILALIWTGIRTAFINVSPTLLEIITLGQSEPLLGGLLYVAAATALGILGALFSLIPGSIQRAVLSGAGWVVGIGILSEILVNVLRQRMSRGTLDEIFGAQGIRPMAALALFAAIALYTWLWNRWGRTGYIHYRRTAPARQQRVLNGVGMALLALLLLVLPSLMGVYLSEIVNNVGLYILMGLGLNIAIGLAGLLDLGYVTNFAVGAYVMAVLTSSGPLGIESQAQVGAFSFWMALPICVLAAMFAGFVLALPVLRMRGDYLAITTLGFGEIIRILARSDALAPFIGGAQGILQIPKAALVGWWGWVVAVVLYPINIFLGRFGLSTLAADQNVEIVFGTPPQLYYLLVLACLLVLFVSVRLNNSRTGRQWMAMREDEDVAAAMGIDTTKAKIIAFTLSAASGGLAGAIFAAKLGSIYPHSFQLLISINVLSLIIVGGMGSIPGVVVGAFALIGLPELLREFAEFRLLFYGIALIIMMLVRPEGLIPSAVRRRELHSGAQEGAASTRSTEDVASPVVAD